jgi:dolichol-phosphate mannosyltransferase
MLRLATDSVASFSAAPLQLAIWTGAISAFVCVMLLFYALVAYLTGHTVRGWSSLFVMTVFIGGVQLMAIGMLGEYVARIFRTVQGRPSYVVGYDSHDGSRGQLADEPSEQEQP